MRFEFEGEVIEWRGPPPYLFVKMPATESAEIRGASKQLTYGWGCIPASVTIGRTTITTALFPKDGAYLVPIKVALQGAERIFLGDRVRLAVDV